MPFPDELGPVQVVTYRDTWPAAFEDIASRLRSELGDVAAFVVEIDHIGSTSVPGLAAKDVIDVQVLTSSCDGRGDAVAEALVRVGWRRRDEAWNRVEQTREGPEEKSVLAPCPGERGVNVHVRRSGGRGARDSLLFRDFLRHETQVRDDWARFKRAIVDAGIDDLIAYGQIKQPAWSVLMSAADRWAIDTGWTPPSATG